MSLNLNKVTIAGNLTRDPQTRTAGNSVVAVFGLAVNRRWRDRDGNNQEETTFVDVECWGRTAELVGQYLTKGRGAFIEGRLKLDQWEDKDGKRQNKLKVVADSVQFLDSRAHASSGSGSRDEEPEAVSQSLGAVYDEEPPF